MWPHGKPPHCPHCGVLDRMNRLAVQRSKPSKKNPEGKPVHGLWKCYACRKQFTVRKGTVFEESRLELHQWFQAAFLMCSSKKGVSSNQLHRTLGCTLKTRMVCVAPFARSNARRHAGRSVRIRRRHRGKR